MRKKSVRRIKSRRERETDEAFEKRLARHYAQNLRDNRVALFANCEFEKMHGNDGIMDLYANLLQQRIAQLEPGVEDDAIPGFALLEALEGESNE